MPIRTIQIRIHNTAQLLCVSKTGLKIKLVLTAVTPIRRHFYFLGANHIHDVCLTVYRMFETLFYADAEEEGGHNAPAASPPPLHEDVSQAEPMPSSAEPEPRSEEPGPRSEEPEPRSEEPEPRSEEPEPRLEENLPQLDGIADIDDLDDEEEQNEVKVDTEEAPAPAEEFTDGALQPPSGTLQPDAPVAQEASEEAITMTPADDKTVDDATDAGEVPSATAVAVDDVATGSELSSTAVAMETVETVAVSWVEQAEVSSPLFTLTTVGGVVSLEGSSSLEIVPHVAPADGSDVVAVVSLDEGAKDAAAAVGVVAAGEGTAVRGMGEDLLGRLMNESEIGQVEPEVALEGMFRDSWPYYSLNRN